MTAVADFVRDTLGHQPKELPLFERAFSHSSAGRDSYERLEFLGDRVLGLVVARWLYERFPSEPEGNMSRRYNALVARETCMLVGRDIGVSKLIRLAKHARDDGTTMSDNVIGDVVEALLGALILDGGLDGADAFVRRAWAPYLETQVGAPQHPKSALQEFAASRGFAVPVYALLRRSGAHHAPRFTVRVSIASAGDAEADGSTKQEAETEAAAALLEKLQ